MPDSAVCFVDEESREVCAHAVSLSTAEVPIDWDDDPYGPTLTDLRNVANVCGCGDEFPLD